ncbi:group III truncated hemoglobin [Flavobacterium silvaticum]|uniref:Group III truncated hemoglobin n=1 Tax=Flavobacterium silvaticum TaxID=1852020 RepID=A0A972JKZ3_9FLAO|nr:group III truncated hemoglobin [Flavobacterium silvaticum]NMH29637.1 group III truncated hemoglobin [Flavobacterium silvaticum]
MTDIRNTDDLRILFGNFYKELLLDAEMHHIFIAIAKLDIDKHLPIIVSFWEQVIFGSGNYKTNVLEIHRHLHNAIRLEQHHFKIWLDTLFKVIDLHYSGENSEKIKTRALSISQVMQLKLDNFLTQN